MKIRHFAAPLLLVIVLAIACGGGGSTEGKFVSESNPKDYLQLRSDGSFFQEEGGRSFSGTYKIYGTEIILTLPSGAASKGTINGDVLIDPDGERWIKGGVAKKTAGKDRSPDFTQAPNDSSGPIKQAEILGCVSTIIDMDPSGNKDPLPNHPRQIALSPDGKLFMVNSEEHSIHMLNLKTKTMTSIAGTGQDGFSGDGGHATSAQLSEPGRLTVDGSGNLFFSDWGNSRIRKIDAGTGTITTVAQTSHPQGLAADDMGNLFFAKTGREHLVYRVGVDGEKTVVAGKGDKSVTPADIKNPNYVGDGGPATSALLNNPLDVAVDTNGDLYIVDNRHYRIRKVEKKTGIISTVVGTGERGQGGDGGLGTRAQLQDPYGLDLDQDGNLFIADAGGSYDGRIRRLDGKTGIISTVGAIDSSGSCEESTILDQIAPIQVEVAPDGSVFFLDTGTIRKIEFP